nr:hypothetical protein [Streptomyces sp. S1D4-11]
MALSSRPDQAITVTLARCPRTALCGRRSLGRGPSRVRVVRG